MTMTCNAMDESEAHGSPIQLLHYEKIHVGESATIGPEKAGHVGFDPFLKKKSLESL